MKDNSFKYKTPKEISPELLDYFEKQAKGDECKLQFLLWARGTWLEVHFGKDDAPVFRPAACAWEAWKAAWSLKSKGARK